MKNRKSIFKVLLTLFLLWFFGHVLYITIDGLSDNGEKADIAVILGNKVNEDGTLSERLEKRLECGLRLYQNHRVKKIIVSGGLGKEGYYEGDKMKEYLIANKVPDSVIIVDNLGNNTRATVDNTMRLKDSLHFESVLVVSQYFHVTRTKMLFKERGFQNVSSVSPDYFEFKDIYSLLREFAGYYTQ
ncbi:YdcF family protein [Flavobacterium circumlabens]|uniref:Vancomycin permeability regulator SanA n=1 Tax=Flavobacterium circumlabens TaxID=2133765 RepID=A0A4Y7UBS0_9FLAO|nr:YdcF family protein [Flavobacterium circumlabens]TCN57435.1 vancomycin permeability regulator SanA [Flavobacterium circumlabens]TEB43754.1 YdcF family protein [Flavobacterium circumlabens]